MAKDEMLATQSLRPPVIGIGASAGGVEAVSELLELLPADTGAAFVVIMHLAPEVRSELTHILAVHTKMPVLGVTARMPLQPNHVYVILPDRQLQISDREISAAH
jgi:two-component system CheB/CheR fusion protein